MTIKPYTKAEAVASLPKELPDSTIEYINDFLKRTFVGSPTHLDYSSTARRITSFPDLINAVKNHYETAGWRVTFHSDQRDGDFWTFS